MLGKPVARLPRPHVGDVRQAHRQHEPPAVAGLGVTRHQSLSGTSDHAGRPSRSSSVLPKWLIIKGFRGCLGPSWANMALYQALYHFYSTSCARERRGTAAGRGKVDRGDSIPWENGGGLAAVGPAICVSGGVMVARAQVPSPPGIQVAQGESRPVAQEDADSGDEQTADCPAQVENLG